MKKILCSLPLCLLVLALLATAAPAAEKPKAASDVQDLVFLAEGRPLLIRLHIRLDGKPYLAAWEEFVNYVFDQYDKNKDGVLDKDEAARIPPPQSFFGGGGAIYTFPGGPAVGGGNMDANRDGKVTREELANYFRRSGGAPFQLTQGGNQQNQYYTQVVLDYNGRVPGGNSAEALNKALMKLLDTDKDGKLSRKELAAAPAILLKKDVNDDEIVTSEELLGEAPVGQYGLNDVVFATDYSASVPATDSPLVAVTPGEPARALARKLLDRYGAKGDAKKTGKLTRKDLGLDEESFRQLDADEDGQLDAEELARFARRSPDIELSITLGTGQGVKIVPGKRKKPEGFRLTDNQDGSVTLGVGNTHVDLKIEGAGQGGVWRFTPPDQASFYKMQFNAADQDNNGYLDMNEARRSPFGALFKAMDADGDGKLYLKEVLAYFEKQKALQDRARAACLSMSIADQGKGLFDLLDKNGDGRLSVREMREAAKLIDKLDQNGDGMLESNEIPRRYAVSARRGPAGGSNYGLGGVVAVSYPRQMGRPVPQQSAGPMWFRKMDRNRDGDVSRREFLGSDELFKKIDLDGDGLISVEEAEKADALFRKQTQRK